MSFCERFPEVFSQLHPTKNGHIDTSKLRSSSRTRVWWLCTKAGCGCPHEWESTVANRTDVERGCPFCAGQRVCYHDSLAVRAPEIAASLHPEKNHDSAEALGLYSDKIMWWICPVKSECGCVHEWQSTVSNRVAGNGCPVCFGRKPCPHTSLAGGFPDIAKQLHPTRNGKLVPAELTAYSHKRLWWLCPNKPDCGCVHEWQTKVYCRTRFHTGCPYCARKKVCVHGTLAIRFPKLAAELHPTRNTDVDISTITALSPKKLWWQCTAGHEWAASVSNRTFLKSGCPVCACSKLEDAAIAALTELGIPFIQHYRLDIRARTSGNVIVDFFLPDHDIIIELDGRQHFQKIKFFHREPDTFMNQRLRDIRLNAFVLQHPTMSMLRVAYSDVAYVAIIISAFLNRPGALKVVFSNPRLYSGRSLTDDGSADEEPPIAGCGVRK